MGAGFAEGGFGGTVVDFCGASVGFCGTAVAASFAGGAFAAPLASVATLDPLASVVEAGASKPSGSIPDASSSSTLAGAETDAAFESEYVDQ